MIIYIDESGDLGWNFTKPYRRGGSSRFLTISCLAVPSIKKHHPRRIVKELYNKFSISTKIEVKGSLLSSSQKTFLTNKVINLLTKHQDINIYSITVNKANVAQHIRKDGNKIYNYMLSLLLLDQIKNEDSVTIIPDPRNIKVKSGNSMIDYLQTKLWFELNSKTEITEYRIPSDQCDNLKFIDMVSNILWKSYEDGDEQNAMNLRRHIICKRLFFS